ncbi:Gfo/Idh/MocA family oxidoreductase [Paenibacillus graminis]|uniref:Gfo/Idh/MocA family protein n=1 Tax=Paenibacillus graminis TaxID=189425 RepID=UPI002DB7E6A9|nr:Gfo/Idh/MocA family oxidoreductase [Paenibacillus graminis]MEC0169842.1 Gfo/Idh/MocA family oxidoreductase [Paenibacillus graminis]
MSSTKDVSLGIIGAGWVAEHGHLPSFLSMEGVSFGAVYDTDASRAAHLAEQAGAKACTSLSEVSQIPLDAVLVCTPNHTHYELAKHFLQQGIHVLCEKPMTTTAEEAASLRRIAEASGAVLLMGFVNRYRDDIRELRSRITSGHIGDVQVCEVIWRRKKGIPRPGSWFTQQKMSGGGVLIDLGSHMIDQMLFLTDAPEPVACLAGLHSRPVAQGDYSNWLGSVESDTVEVEDTAIGMIQFANGMLGRIHVSWQDDVEGDLVEIHLKGSRGSVILRTLFGFSNQGLYKQPSLQFTPAGQTSVWFKFPPKSDVLIDFRRQAHHFVECIRETKQPGITAEDGERVIRLIQLLYQSAHKGLVAT